MRVFEADFGAHRAQSLVQPNIQLNLTQPLSLHLMLSSCATNLAQSSKPEDYYTAKSSQAENLVKKRMQN